MAHRATLNTTFRCDNMLHVFESVEKRFRYSRFLITFSYLFFMNVETPVFMLKTAFTSIIYISCYLPGILPDLSARHWKSVIRTWSGKRKEKENQATFRWSVTFTFVMWRRHSVPHQKVMWNAWFWHYGGQLEIYNSQELSPRPAGIPREISYYLIIVLVLPFPGLQALSDVQLQSHWLDDWTSLGR